MMIIMKVIKSIGDCIKCGEEIIIYRSKSRNRFIKCYNTDCDFSYPLPRAGHIENSGLICPKNKLPILIITKKNQNVTYFWVDGPCFTCKDGSNCPPLVDLREEYENE